MLKHMGTVELETKRLRLRKFESNDAEDTFNNWANDSDVTRCLSWKPHGLIDVSKEIISTWINSYKNQDFYNWAIFLKGESKVIGSIGIVNFSNEHQSCEIGYCIAKDSWNKGVMTEALNRIITYLLVEVGFNRIQAIHHIDNPASGKVMVKAGMRFEGRLRHYHVNNNGFYVDCDMYSILKSDINIG